VNDVVDVGGGLGHEARAPTLLRKMKITAPRMHKAAQRSSSFNGSRKYSVANGTKIVSVNMNACFTRLPVQPV
jgi:hypothetical protein